MTTLTDRYVHAVTSQLPSSQRAEIGREMRATIQDTVEGRAPGVDADEAERRALLDLGHPSRLADGYRGAPKALIGPRVYPAWVRLNRILLSVVPAVVAVIALLVALSQGQGAWAAVWSGVGAAISAAVQVLLWVTIAFVIVERTGADSTSLAPLLPDEDWSLDNLPDPDDRQVGWGEAVTILITAVVGLALLLSRIPVITVDGAGTPLLTDSALTWRWVIVAGLLLAVVVGVVVLLRGRWTMPNALLNLASNLLVGVPLITLLVREQFFDSAALGELVPSGMEWDQTPTMVTAGIVLGAILVWDSVDALRRSRPKGR